MIGVVAWLLVGCASLPPIEGRTASSAFTDTDDTRLGRAVAGLAAANPGRTAVHQMANPRDAFAARVLLAETAERSLDVQYFIWHHDQVGLLLFEALKKAADRGVRVRMLLDDAYTQEIETAIASLDAHPNIELRLYNPFPRGEARALSWLTDFTRLNKRMHNKSFTADNQLSVFGGRNIGNEYFGAGKGVNFADIDVLAAGAVVHDVSRQFDLYWNSVSAYPAAGVQRPPEPGHEARLDAAFAANRVDPESLAYLEAVRSTPILRDLLEHRLEVEWTTATLVHDDPAKTLDSSGRTDLLLFPQLVRRLGQPQKSLDIVSPYFVPGDEGSAALMDAARRGVKVRVLTNSLAASDESAVHSGYAKHRPELLRAGVELYELKPVVERESTEVKGRFGSGSSAGLHAKSYAVDGQRIFIGSFNFDQRSARLNTEMGVVLNSPAGAQRLGKTLDDGLDKVAYELRLAPDGVGLAWIEHTAAGQRRFDTDPETSWWLRLRVDLLALLPIEWLL